MSTIDDLSKEELLSLLEAQRGPIVDINKELLGAIANHAILDHLRAHGARPSWVGGNDPTKQKYSFQKSNLGSYLLGKGVQQPEN